MIRTCFSQEPSFTCWVLSRTLFISPSPPLSSSPSLFLCCCAHMMEYWVNEGCFEYLILKGCISREVQIEHVFFSLHLFCQFLPLLLHPSFFPLSIPHHLCHYINVHLSLPQLVVRRCRQKMSQSWREARPRSLADCRTTMDQSWSSRIPAGRLFSSMAQEVWMHIHGFLIYLHQWHFKPAF